MCSTALNNVNGSQAESSQKVKSSKPIQQISIFYDGDCPLCSSYAKYQELAQVAEEVELRNLREENEKFIHSLLDQAVNPDKGMVVRVTYSRGPETVLFGGKDAVRFLAMFDSQRSLLGLAHRALRVSFINLVLYSFLFLGRRLLLLALFRSPRIVRLPETARSVRRKNREVQ